MHFQLLSLSVEELDLAAEEAEDKSDEMATILARKWRGHMSELEVDDEQVTQTRPLVRLTLNLRFLLKKLL